MVSGDGAIAQTRGHDERWKWPLIALCALAFIWIVLCAIDLFGLGGRPWFGFWDTAIQASSHPFELSVNPRAGGASARAGIRTGDRFDLREQSLGARVRLLTGSLTMQPTRLVIRRGSSTLVTQAVGSTVWEGQPFWKLVVTVPGFVISCLFLACAFLISVRRPGLVEARVLALILLFSIFGNNAAVTPVLLDPALTLFSFAASMACGFAAWVLLVNFSSRFGAGYSWRRPLVWLAYATIFLAVLWAAACFIGTFTLRIDPLTYWWNGIVWSLGGPIVAVMIVVVASSAVVSTPRSDRPRVAWLLLPLPIAFAVSYGVGILNPYMSSWIATEVTNTLSNAPMLVGALLVTYALLKRRVLDVGFVLSRTIAVAGVSLVVVGAFVLLEWVLGPVLTGASHATGVIANATLALVLGVSLRFIHQRIDKFVDVVMFRKRYDNERALRAFSKEVAFVTERGTLLDQALGKLRDHTDARSAALLVKEHGVYEAARRFGDAPVQVDENDPAILALKTWHTPLDPHHYETAMNGALAFPMVARGQLLGVLLCGERAGGEAYAPDEIDALSAFAHGVGAALDVFGVEQNRAGQPAFCKLAELREDTKRDRELVLSELAELREAVKRTSDL